MNTLLLSVLLDIGRKLDKLLEFLGLAASDDRRYVVYFEVGKGYLRTNCYVGDLYSCIEYIAHAPKIKYQIESVEPGAVVKLGDV